MNPSDQCRRERLQNPLDLATASVTISRTSRGFIIVQSLPAGMDIAPDVWRLVDEDAAERRFNRQVAALKDKGFTQPATY